MNTLRALLADDEAPARRALRRALTELDDVAVVGEAATGIEVLDMVRSLRPDLLFLDIRMPGMSGLEVTRQLQGEKGPAVVFVTAHDEYAVQAFEQAALDYVLKPVHPERVAESVRRVRENSAPRMDEVVPQILAGVETTDRKTALLRVGASLHVVDRDAVRFLEAAGNYVRVHEGEGYLLVRGTLTQLVDKIGGELVRIHRSYAVRIAEIVEIRRLDGNDPTAYLRGGEEIPVGRTYWAALERLLGS